MNVIVINFPEAIFWDETSKYNKLINKFVIAGISPDTLVGKQPFTVTTYQKIEGFIALQQAYSDALFPSYVDFFKEMLNDGVQTVCNHNMRGKASVNIDFFIKLTNAKYTSNLTPVGLIGSLGTGTGEEGDAEADVQRTWEQWNNFAQNGQILHSNDTHKFLPCWANGNKKAMTTDHYKAFLNHTVVGYEVLSPNDFQAQLALDNE